MKSKILLLLIISFFAFSSNVSAGICDSEHIKQLKELAKQVEVSYEYLDYSDEIIREEDEEYSIDRYALEINLLSNELFLSYDNNNYYYTGENFRFFTGSGNVKMKIYSSKCSDQLLRTINLKLPKFNPFSYKPECETLAEYNLNVCDPWYQGSVDEVSFYKVVNKYLETSEEEVDKWALFLSFFSKYFIYFIAFILIILTVILLLKRYRKRWELG